MEIGIRERREIADCMRTLADEGYGVCKESIAYALGLEDGSEGYGDEDVFNALADLVEDMAEWHTKPPSDRRTVLCQDKYTRGEDRRKGLFTGNFFRINEAGAMEFMVGGMFTLDAAAWRELPGPYEGSLK